MLKRLSLITWPWVLWLSGCAGAPVAKTPVCRPGPKVSAFIVDLPPDLGPGPGRFLCFTPKDFEAIDTVLGECQ